MKVWELLSSPEKWTKGHWAKNEFDGNVASTSKDAVCWCVVGALMVCYPSFKEYKEARDKLSHLVRDLSPDRDAMGYIAIWNDDPKRTYEEVHAVLKELDI